MIAVWKLSLTSVLFASISMVGIQRAVAEYITIVDATYGANCGASAGNATEYIKSKCDGQLACTYVINVADIGDPAYGCRKEYLVRYTCGNANIRSASAEAEAGYGSTVSLICGTPVLGTSFDPALLRSTEELVAMLQRAGRIASPGSGSLGLDDASLESLRSTLDKYGLTNREFAYLAKRYFGRGDGVDLREWKKFPDFVADVFVTEDQLKKANRLDGNLKSGLKLTNDETAYLRDKFFHSNRLRNPDTSINHDNYESFVTDTIYSRDPEFVEQLSDQSRRNVESLVRAFVEPALRRWQGPIVRAATDGDTRFPCTYSAMLKHMMGTSPKFKLEWDTHVGVGGSVTALSLGNDRGVSSAKRNLLAAAVAEAVRRCKQNRL